MTGTIAIVVFVVGMIGSIMVHEWGHFATARRFGMRADRFFLGFGPTIWSTRRGETEYGVKLLPLGGFVRIRGMGEEDDRRPGLPVALSEALQRGDHPADSVRLLAVERGAPPQLARRLADRFVRNSGDDVEPTHAAALARQLITSEVPSTDRPGDLHHRLLRGDEGRFFGDRPRWQRAIVLASGSALHFAQAIVLLFLGYLLFGQSVVVPQVSEFVTSAQFEGAPAVSPAAEAGLEVGDLIVAVNGVVSDDFAVLREEIRARPGRETSITVERDGEQLEVLAVPAVSQDPETGEVVGVLGFVPDSASRPLPADEALYRTLVGEGSVPGLAVGTVGALVDVFGPEGVGSLFAQLSGEAERDAEGGISVVGAASVAGQGTATFGPFFLFVLLANVNVFIGVFNALPLPPLDGGHLAVLGVESGVNAVRRRRGRTPDFTIDPRTVASIAVPVILLVVVVSLGLVWLDIVDPIRLP